MSAPVRIQSVPGVVAEDGKNNQLIFAGTTVPTDASPGYAAGCLFQKLDGATAITVLYVNAGSASSCSFKPVLGFTAGAALTAQLTTITHTAAGTPDYAIANTINTNAYGFASADEFYTVLAVIANLQTRLAEVEARLEGLGIVTAN